MVQRTWSGRLVAGTMVLSMVASAVWGVSTAVAPMPAGAVEVVPATYRYDPVLEDGWSVFGASQYPVSMSEDGLSVGFVNDPPIDLFARGEATLAEDDGAFLYAVADAREDGSGRDLWSLEPPPGTPWAHPGHSHLSGDGLTFVATYNARYGGLPCDNSDPSSPDSLYLETQVFRWVREDRGSDFGDPVLVSVSDPTECNGVIPGPGPDLTGVGGDAESWSPTVSDDGSEIAFARGRGTCRPCRRRRCRRCTWPRRRAASWCRAW